MASIKKGEVLCFGAKRKFYLIESENKGPIRFCHFEGKTKSVKLDLKLKEGI